MSVKMSEIISRLEELASEQLAEGWDNVGLLVGDASADVNKVLAALDITDGVITEAEEIGADCIITHHPVIFSKLGRITADTPQGRRLIRLIRSGISVYTAHTNLDISEGGTNDILAQMIKLKNIENLPLGRAGELERPMPLRELAREVKNLLKLEYIGYYGDSESVVKKAGIITGSGCESEYIRDVAGKGCDVFITGDIKYHYAQEALDMGLSLIDATHYASEALIVNKLCVYLKERFNGLEIIPSKLDGQLLRYV